MFAVITTSVCINYRYQVPGAVCCEADLLPDCPICLQVLASLTGGGRGLPAVEGGGGRGVSEGEFQGGGAGEVGEEVSSGGRLGGEQETQGGGEGPGEGKGKERWREEMGRRLEGIIPGVLVPVSFPRYENCKERYMDGLEA